MLIRRSCGRHCPLHEIPAHGAATLPRHGFFSFPHIGNKTFLSGENWDIRIGIAIVGLSLPMQACVPSFRNRRSLSPPSCSCIASPSAGSQLFYPCRTPFPTLRFLVAPTYAAGSFPVQRYGGRTPFKYRCRYLKRNLTTTFRNRRLRHFVKFHSRFLVLCSCIPRLERT